MVAPRSRLSATRFAAFRAQLEAFAPQPGWRALAYEFLLFGIKQAWACLFGGLMLALLLGLGLVATFIWFAENLGTFANAWTYPNQHHGWEMVSPAKLGAWLLLMYISFLLVAAIHPPRAANAN